MLNVERSRRALSAAGAFLVLVAAAALATALPGHSQGGQPTQNVKVVNTIAEAVPTAAQGTTNVAGTIGLSTSANTVRLDQSSGSNTVKAEQSGTWNVGITGTPTVNLGGTPTVEVGNTAADPVPQRDIDNPARQPFQASFNLSLANNEVATSGTFVVPGGKRLVIEYVSARILVQPGQLPELHWETRVAGITRLHFLTPIRVGTSGTVDLFNISQQTRLYADSNTQPRAVFVRTVGSVAGSAQASVAVSGYLVDVP